MKPGALHGYRAYPAEQWQGRRGLDRRRHEGWWRV